MPFSKQLCAICNRIQWHYAEFTRQAAHCTEHSLLTSKPVVHIYTPVPDKEEVLTPDQQQRIAALTTKWKSGAGTCKLDGVRVSPTAMKQLGFTPIVATPKSNKLLCTFCGKETDNISCTRGKGVPRILVGDLITSRDGEIIEDRIVTVSAAKQIACPSCCLHITNVVDTVSG